MARESEVLWGLFHTCSLLFLEVQLCKHVFRNCVSSIMLVISRFWDTNTTHIFFAVNWTLNECFRTPPPCSTPGFYVEIIFFLGNSKNDGDLELGQVSYCFCTFFLTRMCCLSSQMSKYHQIGALDICKTSSSQKLVKLSWLPNTCTVAGVSLKSRQLPEQPVYKRVGAAARVLHRRRGRLFSLAGEGEETETKKEN